jgi:hypothetical protein
MLQFFCKNRCPGRGQIRVIRFATEFTQVSGHRANIAMNAHSYATEARYTF